MMHKPLSSLRKAIMLCTILCSVMLQQACVPLAVTAVGAGVLVAADRRSTGTIAMDKEIEFKGGSALNGALTEPSHVNITSYNRMVLLTGEVANEADKKLVEDTLNRIINVRSVVNELQVGLISGLTARSNDALITGKVKASFVDAKDIFANSFKVVTERGEVYLMGLVTEREGASAADIAARVKGVSKVVKVYEQISEQELKRMSDPANARPAPVTTPAAEPATPKPATQN